MEALGFHIVGYGCTTCIGNSGPLNPGVEQAIRERDLVTSAVISGNRNFSGRVHPLVKANFLSSPALVVAYALLGNVTLDILTHPLGIRRDGEPVFLRDIWPSSQEIQSYITSTISSDMYRETYSNIQVGDEFWENLETSGGSSYPWKTLSSYIQPSPFVDSRQNIGCEKQISGAKALLVLGDSVTTDHISPAGSIPENSPAGKYLMEIGQIPDQFNSFGARRGNASVMVRGTFENPGVNNHLVPEKRGGVTRITPNGEILSVFDASLHYTEKKTPLIILAGKEYGTGSSRDWAAKGLSMLGVRAVIAESFERIHRSNLVMMGILPLQFCEGENWLSLGLSGFETFHIRGYAGENGIRQYTQIQAVSENNEITSFKAKILINNAREWQYYWSGGILPFLLQQK
jgi:aconitate hydratase